MKKEENEEKEYEKLNCLHLRRMIRFECSKYVKKINYILLYLKRYKIKM